MSQAVRAVFLDRDGVLNRATVREGKPYPPPTVEDLAILPGVPEALAALHAAGFLLIGVTNQPDVARGAQRREVVEAIHDRLLAALPLREMLVCYEDDDRCPRRKPNPGLLLEAARNHGLDLAGSFLVGDRGKDVEAGRRAGCRTVFLDRGYCEPVPTPPADFTTDCMATVAAWILDRAPTGE